MSKTIRESLGPVHERNAATIIDVEEDAKSERLAKIERAAKAREKDQAAQKKKATEKHNRASAKSREAVKHFGNKDQFGRPKNEEVEQVDEISVKKKAQAYRKMRDRQADVSYNPHTGKSDMLADTPEKKRANRMLKRIGDKHGKDVKRAVYKSQYEEVETEDQMRQRKIKGAERVHNQRVAAEKEKKADQKKVHSMLRKTRELRKMRGEEVEQVDEKSAAWTRKEGQNKEGGLNAKGRASYERENPGSDLKAPVSAAQAKKSKGGKAAKRRKSFCARMGGMPGPMKDEKGRPTRKALALRKWDC